jgi:hypothetical protein
MRQSQVTVPVTRSSIAEPGMTGRSCCCAMEKDDPKMKAIASQIAFVIVL